MKRIFMSPNDVGTSARSETYNKDRKQAVPRPIIIPKFLLKERRKIAASTKFVFTRSRGCENNEKINTHDNALDLDLEKLVISNDTKTNRVYQGLDELPKSSDVGDVESNEFFQDLNLSQIPADVDDLHFHQTLTYNNIEANKDMKTRINYKHLLLLMI